MPLRYDTITFLSDYGLVDEFVGVVHSVIRSIAPDAAVVDLTHGITPYDVRGGGLALARSVEHLCPGVVLAVVDPAVGTSRRPIAVEVGDGASVLVGPDNGVLAPAVALCGGATRAVEITNPAYVLATEAATFDGRDVFAPVAAHLCNGVTLDELGSPIDPLSLLPGLLPVAREEGDTLVVEVLWVDRFGNCQLNVDADDIAGFGDRIEFRIDGRRRTAAIVSSFSQVGVGDVALLADANGLMALVANQSSAADELSIGSGDQVILAEATAAGGMATAVTLGRRDGNGGAP